MWDVLSCTEIDNRVLHIRVINFYCSAYIEPWDYLDSKKGKLSQCEPYVCMLCHHFCRFSIKAT